MIDSHFRTSYQKIFVDPILNSGILKKVSPTFLTVFSCLFGLGSCLFLWKGMPLAACISLFISGYFDTLDGSVARAYEKKSNVGTVLDIVSDRIVEWAVIFGLYLADPESRAPFALGMTGSVLVCITSFLVVGIFSENETEKSFHYSPGLIERSEAFCFFGVLTLFPSFFQEVSLLFIFLVLLTGLLRIWQFAKKEQKKTVFFTKKQF
jgi:archaetidylinositol phosphate synthase